MNVSETQHQPFVAFNILLGFVPQPNLPGSSIIISSVPINNIEKHNGHYTKTYETIPSKSSKLSFE